MIVGALALGAGAFGSPPDERLPVVLSGTSSITTYSVNLSATLAGTSRLEANWDFRVFAATSDYITTPTDVLPNRIFTATLLQPGVFSRSILTSDGIGGMQAGWGEALLDNTEGDYDYLIDGYAIDGRPITIKIGAISPDWPYGDFITVLSGVSQGWHVAEDTVTIRIRDNATRLEVPVLPATYAGTGGAEGGADMAGKRKPRVFGAVKNVSAPLIIPASLAYHLNDGPVAAVSACYVRGKALTAGANHATLTALLAATVSPGTFATCRAAGWARLAFANTDEAGQVTWDVSEGVRSTADVVSALLDIAEVDTVDAASLAALGAAQPAPVGIYFGLDDQTEVGEAINSLLGGVGGFGGFTGTGVFQAGIFRAPANPPVASFTRLSIIDIERREMPSGLTPPPWRFRVIHDRNWTVQESGLAGVVAETQPARVAWLKEPYRVAESADPAIKAGHPLAQDPEPIPAYFVAQADAQAEAVRRRSLFGTARSLYWMRLKTRPWQLRVGDCIAVTFPRWDLRNGALMRLVEVSEDAQAGVTEVVGFA